VPFTVPSGSTVTQDVALSRQVSAVVALRVTPSVLDIDGGPVLVTIEGSGLGSWAEAATLQRWDGDDLSLSMTPDGADDVAMQIDPDDLRPDYGREGLWWLTVEGDGGAVPLPRAVVVVGEGDASFQLSGVSVVDDAGGAGVHRLTVMGDAMPRGSDVLLIGPQGAVVWPAEVETESTTMINALFDGAALADGWWDVVLAGGAHWRALDDALYCDDGMFTDPGGDDDDDAADDDDVTGDDDTAGDDDTGDDDAGDDDADDPGDDDEPLQISGSGCQCGHAGEFPGTAILMIGALLGFVIRRR
jgi:hypothetical protein